MIWSLLEANFYLVIVGELSCLEKHAIWLWLFRRTSYPNFLSVVARVIAEQC